MDTKLPFNEIASIPAAALSVAAASLARKCTWLLLLLILGAPSAYAREHFVGFGDGCNVQPFVCFGPTPLTITVGDSVRFSIYADTVPTGPANVVADDGSFRCAMG
ncbi:MAG: hypothetical protein ACREO3_00360, partial [Arenimonas sp.]